MNALLRRTLRSVREHTMLTLVSTGVIAAGLLLVGIYAMAVTSLRAVVGTWEHDVHVSAYLRPAVTDEARAAVQASLEARPEVAAVRYVSEAEARAWLNERMPELGPVVGDLGEGTLPASFEITLRPEHTSAAALTAFVAEVQAGGPYEDVDYGQEWVARLTTFLSLLGGLGVALGGIIAVAALFLVANTIHLVVYARRDELEIMRLVGATDGYILAPFVAEGALQGLVASTIAVGTLWAVHQGLVLRLQSMLTLALGTQTLPFLPAAWVAGMAGAGVLLGTGAAYGAVRRFLRSLP